jgi:TatD DNase family protein
MIDTHCHLYAEEFKNDIDEVIVRAQLEGVKAFFLPAIDSGQINNMLSLEKKYPNTCYAMMGLHPCYVKENYKTELSIVQDWLSKRSFAAVGEIGLDFYWDKTFSAQQHEAFHAQIEMALQYHLPIVIHTRNAMNETIEIVKQYSSQGLRGIFHCFSGSYESAKEIIKAGFYLGIGGVVTYKNAGLAEVIQQIDLQHLVLETDAPYLSPLPFRGKRNESSYLKFIVQKIAEIKNIHPAIVIEVTTANAKNIFANFSY